MPDYRGALAESPPYYHRIVRDISRQANEPSTVIAHSGAGALVPALALAVPLQGAIFADALLPHPGRPWFDTVPTETKTKLLGLAHNGRLARWTAWWPEGAIANMIGDEKLYADFANELGEMPLGYFEEKAPAIDLPRSVACAYLQFSAGYDDEAAKAERWGWPVQRLALHHLAAITDPETVADALGDLLDIRT